MRLADGTTLRNNVHAFGHQLSSKEVDAGKITSGLIQAGNEPLRYWISARAEYNWNSRCRGLGRKCANPTARYGNDAHPTPHEISSELSKSTVLTLRPAEFERHILPFLITALGETFAECSHLLGPLPRGPAVEKANDGHCRRLLGARRKWH